MNYFKIYISKKEFKTITDKILPTVSKCGPYQNFSCKWLKEFLLTCSQCKDTSQVVMKTLEDCNKIQYISKKIKKSFLLKKK